MQQIPYCYQYQVPGTRDTWYLVPMIPGTWVAWRRRRRWRIRWSARQSVEEEAAANPIVVEVEQPMRRPNEGGKPEQRGKGGELKGDPCRGRAVIVLLGARGPEPTGEAPARERLPRRQQRPPCPATTLPLVHRTRRRASRRRLDPRGGGATATGTTAGTGSDERPPRPMRHPTQLATIVVFVLVVTEREREKEGEETKKRIRMLDI
ncbi:hypothetical protein OsJ_30906 [Oryza sativa Japonica Group]|uniref:Uncharacterized protein n=1 Tax=Oryza sativa subsp. japonica TaxID=39947 RepID=A3C332_ORYSJ|nr:hypothetical protein OsJ_30906 [Oryza sativa Japonica Group]